MYLLCKKGKKFGGPEKYYLRSVHTYTLIIQFVTQIFTKKQAQINTHLRALKENYKCTWKTGNECDRKD